MPNEDVIANAVRQLDREAAAHNRANDKRGAARLRRIAEPLRALLAPPVAPVVVTEDDGETD